MEESNHPPPKQVPKTAPVASSRNSNVKKQPQNVQTELQEAMENDSDGQNNYGITKEGGSQIKISEMISDIFDSIPELYEAITDVKSHISERNSSICNNLKTNNLSLSQINETLMCFENVLRTIKASNNYNSFGNKINEQSAIIKESTDKYYKFNIDDIIETTIKQAINIIKTASKKVLDDISNSFTEVKTYHCLEKVF
ncbi:hypothetical protein O181_094889 [Austropuccinia psidii MF-1]|uniref:Uncharacterized protein n=1 Tax=Austropuccinia psidii MF-1 TaxID=1389203 RepID=A0A9Q3J498_9BASI|nr:hypothetical protein [Austropuccinia psidii MF-1]